MVSKISKGINPPLLDSTICLDINYVSDSVALLELVLGEGRTESAHLYWRKYVDSLIIPFSLKFLQTVRKLVRGSRELSDTPAKRIARSRTKTCWMTHLDSVR
jgi:hypothetical protein